jgi:hypothetical protein
MKSTPPSGSAGDACCVALPTADERRIAEQAMQSATTLSNVSTLVLGPRFTPDWPDGTPLRERTRARCRRMRCPSAYVMCSPFVDLREAEDEARRHVHDEPGSVRWFAEVRLQWATAVDGRGGALRLTEQLVEQGDPRALRLLRALSDEGVDLVWIAGRSRHQGSLRVAVLFAGGLDRRVRILHEGTRTLRRNGTWGPLMAVGASGPPSCAERIAGRGPERRDPARRARWARHVLLDLASASLASVATKLFAAVVGTSVNLPLWALLVCVFAVTLTVRAVAAGRRVGRGLNADRALKSSLAGADPD